MAFFISTVKLSEREVVLELPRDTPGIVEIVRSDQTHKPDIATWLKDHSEQPVVIISPFSGSEILEQLNQTNPFGYQLSNLDKPQGEPFSGPLRNGPCIEEDPAGVNDQHKGDIRQLTSEINDLKRQLAVEIEQRSRTHDALRANKQQLLLTSSTLHDINNLLLVIYFSSKQVLSQMAEDDANRPPMLAIQDARNQAIELTRRLRTILSAGPGELIGVDLNHLIIHSEEIFRGLIQGNVIMTVNLSPTPAKVSGDTEMIERMILNLLLNAHSAIPEGGWITIETGHDDISSDDSDQGFGLPPGRYVVLRISDTGSGSKDQARLRQLGECLDMVSPPDTPEQALATVDQIVKRYGGRFDSVSSADIGTRIEIRFPAASPLPSAFEPTNPGTESAKGVERILVVEDEAYIRKYIAISLEARGYSVLEAPDAENADAIAKSSSEPIDLLLVDSILPGLAGSKVAEEFWKARPDLPVIFMSGLSMHEVISDSPGRGNIGFLQKPFAADELLMTVRNALDNRDRTP